MTPMASTDASDRPHDRKGRPGPKRKRSAPVGPDAVRRAVLESAARLFAEEGVAHVSLRDIAEAADVQLALIGRYVGTRYEVIDQVFHLVNAQAASDIVAHPLEQLATGRDSSIGRWLALLTHYSTVGERPPSDGPNPVRSLATVLESVFGLDQQTAGIRSAQIAASALGWRLFETYLVEAADIDEVGVDTLRSDLNSIQRQIGSTTWPTPRRG